MSNTILIVDDQVEVTQILREYFHLRKGYNVLTAADGKIALDLIKNQTPELVLLDMKLPSVNGLEILKILRKDYPNCKVIVMTAYDAEYKKEIDVVGYDSFFIKPIAFEELKNTIEGLLTGKIPQQTQLKPVSTGASGEKTPFPRDEKNLIPKARIVIIEIRGNIAMLLKEYLEGYKEEGLYNAVYFKSGSLFLKEIVKFNPDIVLYDIIEIGSFSEFASSLMDLPHPPKEIILFGDPKFKWDEVDALVKEGMNYIPTPLSSPGPISKQYHEFELPTKDTVERLAGLIRDVCLKHGLVTQKGESHV